MSDRDTQELREQIASDVREIKQAVLGDKAIGLNGLVDDMKEMKTWRANVTVKAAVVSGAVSSAATPRRYVFQSSEPVPARPSSMCTVRPPRRIVSFPWQLTMAWPILVKHSRRKSALPKKRRCRNWFTLSGPIDFFPA